MNQGKLNSHFLVQLETYHKHFDIDYPNLVPRGCIPFGQHQGCKTSGIINVKMLANRNLIGYYFLPEVYEKEVSKQEIKVLRMLLLDVFDHVRDGQWERNLKMGDAN